MVAREPSPALAVVHYRSLAQAHGSACGAERLTAAGVPLHRWLHKTEDQRGVTCKRCRRTWLWRGHAHLPLHPTPQAPPLDPRAFQGIVKALREQGYGDDIQWSESCGPPASPEAFALEAAYVICNSGMKNTVARGIYEAVKRMLEAGGSSRNVFGHTGKCDAIDIIWARREEFYTAYMAAPDKVEFCATLPHIGPVTKYHLAKNFGADVAKPDVHLQRLAGLWGSTPQGLCDALAAATGLKARTVDVVLWRACATGLLDSRTGVVNPTAKQTETTP